MKDADSRRLTYQTQKIMKIEILFYMLFFTCISLVFEPASAQNKSNGVTAVSAIEFLNFPYILVSEMVVIICLF